MTRGGGAEGASQGPDGKPPRHVPVLVSEVLESLAPKDGEIYIDGTFGAGGYTRAILGSANCKVLALDRDPNAVRAAAQLINQAPGRLNVVEAPFSQLEDIAGTELSGERPDGIVLDIGVSSMQLDQAERGFSFRQGGPLDMRMGHDGPTAADVVAKASETDLANIIYIFGEERHSRAVARAIVAARKEAAIASTRALADIVARVVRGKPGDIHPATRTFQAIRIYINQELTELEEGLEAAEQVLKPGGRLAIVTFHSRSCPIITVSRTLTSSKAK